MTWPTDVRIGTRGSRLALAQAGLVRDALHQAHPSVHLTIVVVETRGDRDPDTPLIENANRGMFTNELQARLQGEAIDLAVHSLKDLPTEPSPETVIAAVLPRAVPNDVLLSRSGLSLSDLPPGAVVGTGSRRRAAQLLHRRPDLRVRGIRGNVDTRIGKVLNPDEPYDATLLAAAGLARLGRAAEATEQLPLETMLPAPGQGAIAVECRRDDVWPAFAKVLDHEPTALAVVAERAFLAGLDAGCSSPVAAYAEARGDSLSLRGRVPAVDGRDLIDLQIAGEGDTPAFAADLGRRLATKALEQGAARLLGATP